MKDIEKHQVFGNIFEDEEGYRWRCIARHPLHYVEFQHLEHHVKDVPTSDEIGNFKLIGITFEYFMKLVAESSDSCIINTYDKLIEIYDHLDFKRRHCYYGPEDLNKVLLEIAKERGYIKEEEEEKKITMTVTSPDGKHVEEFGITPGHIIKAEEKEKICLTCEEMKIKEEEEEEEIIVCRHNISDVAQRFYREVHKPVEEQNVPTLVLGESECCKEEEDEPIEYSCTPECAHAYTIIKDRLKKIEGKLFNKEEDYEDGWGEFVMANDMVDRVLKSDSFEIKNGPKGGQQYFLRLKKKDE